MLTKSQVEEILDDLLQTHDCKVCTEIDAASCRTERDFAAARKALNEHNDAYEEAVRKLSAPA